jgi:hypothetical protein
MLFSYDINAFKLVFSSKKMIIKVKKLFKNRTIKLKAGGEIKEVLVNADLMDNQKNIAICFRGNKDSGIVELSHKEAEDLLDTLKKELNLVKGVKIIRENK